MRRHGPSSASGASKSIAAQTNAVVVGGTLGGLGTEKAIGDVRTILMGNGVFLMRLRMKQLLRTSIFHLARWSGLMPTFRRIFAGRAAILMFHEIQQDCRSELMTGTSAALFEYSLNWLRQEGWEIVSLETCLERLATDPHPAAMRCLPLTTATETMSRLRFPSSSDITRRSWCTFRPAP